MAGPRAGWLTLRCAWYQPPSWDCVQESGCDRSVSHRVWHFAATARESANRSGANQQVTAEPGHLHPASQPKLVSLTCCCCSSSRLHDPPGGLVVACERKLMGIDQQKEISRKKIGHNSLHIFMIVVNHRPRFSLGPELKSKIEFGPKGFRPACANTLLRLRLLQITFRVPAPSTTSLTHPNQTAALTGSGHSLSSAARTYSGLSSHWPAPATCSVTRERCSQGRPVGNLVGPIFSQGIFVFRVLCTTA